MVSYALDQYNIYAPNTYNIIYLAQWVGQSFIPQKTGWLDRIQLMLYVIGAPNADARISIYNAVMATDLPAGSALSTTLFPTTRLPAAAGTRTMLYLQKPVFLSAWKKYAWVAESYCTVANNWYALETTTTNTGYARGTTTYSLNQGASWGTVAYDETFRTYIMSNMVLGKVPGRRAGVRSILS